jgi:hypothetical protein
MNPERHQCSMCGFEWKHGVNGGHSCAETLLANIAALKFENERYASNLRSAIDDLSEENERLQAHNAMLLDAIKGVLPYVVTQVIACNGLKCREPICESCSIEPEEAAQRACDAYSISNTALNATAESTQRWLEKHDAEASMLAGANALEHLLDKFAFFKSEDGLWLADGIAVMAEEMRKK